MKTETSFSTSSLISRSLLEAFVHLLPHKQLRNPVMFVAYLGALFSTGYSLTQFFTSSPSSFNLQISLWLWFTILFANGAHSLATSYGKAQAASLKQMRSDLSATKLEEGKSLRVDAHLLKRGDLILCKAGEMIPIDGEVVDGIATVDESAITGESAPVIRESGGDRSAVTAGSTILSDQLVIRVTAPLGESFLDKIIALIEGAKRQKTPNEIGLNIILSMLTILFVLVVFSLTLFLTYSTAHETGREIGSLPVMISLLVCSIPTTISALLSAIGIAGMSRLVAYKVVAKSGQAIEAAGDVDLLILDKTGTITLGNRMAIAFIAAPGIEEKEVAALAQLASLSDETPEGRSIVELAQKQFHLPPPTLDPASFTTIPFSAQTRMSGIDLLSPEGNPTRSLRKGAVDALITYSKNLGGLFPPSLQTAVESIARTGGTPLLISDGARILGAIHLKDIIKEGIRDRCARLRRMGIQTVMITGDNPITAAAIAAEAGVDDFVAEAKPETKLARLREEQERGRLVAMVGDGTNDAPALAQADVGIAMNTGTQASREAGNMIDLESNPTKMIEVIEIGKQLLMTRGALTTFSIANDLAKYFAILPALFGTLYASEGQGPLAHFNIMHLHSPQSAILSAVIFNALIIVLFIPMALKGVRYHVETAYQLLAKNLTLYGLGGILTPFIGIKLIDLLLVAWGWV